MHKDHKLRWQVSASSARRRKTQKPHEQCINASGRRFSPLAAASTGRSHGERRGCRVARLCPPEARRRPTPSWLLRAAATERAQSAATQKRRRNGSEARHRPSFATKSKSRSGRWKCHGEKGREFVCCGRRQYRCHDLSYMYAAAYMCLLLYRPI